jgi:hypothetical protein
MSDKQDEIIDGARRAGVTLLHSFADRAEFESSSFNAQKRNEFYWPWIRSNNQF